ncbi:MAG: carbamoyltransferase C-terminal domain-containing protein [Candidatus Omnitrophota bacterium]|nr:carbamoyltransferase C-terminal domain-containing protein [Candidatus Omnitrophota bacterium]
MIILGINAYHAEASAALLRDGELLAAAEEERFSRIKHVAGFPTLAIRSCLKVAGLSPRDIDAVAVSRDPWAHLGPKALSLLRRGLLSPAARNRVGSLATLWNLREPLREAFGEEVPRRLKIHFVEHHRAHIASSYYPSGWDRAAVLSLDGFGDSLSALWGIGEGNHLSVSGQVRFPHSLGILYTAVTQFLGFPHWGDEYKVMGLAAFGRPDRYRSAMEKLCREAERGGYELEMGYFRHHQGDYSMTWAAGAPTLSALFNGRVEELLGPPRAPDSPLDERHFDLASALQERLERIVLNLLRRLADRTRISRLCYAGGVALNCTLNGKIMKETPFKEVFIQPAAHDAGTSLGAALMVAHHLHGLPRRFVMTHASWGPDVVEAECRQALEKEGISPRRLEEGELCRQAAEALAGGKIIGWFQGRMEFGPRSLGCRSLLADPRDPAMKDRINERIKRRERFRPFAPSVRAEAVKECFPEAPLDPFMLFTTPASPSWVSKIPSALHVDGTGRLQAVTREANPLFWQLIGEFQQRTGVPVLLNTSFNEQEPIVCRPEEALACFRRNGVDALALGPFWVVR